MIRLAVAAGTILVLGSVPSKKVEDFKTVAWRAAKALRGADWRSFSADAAPTIIVEERWRAYGSYFAKGATPQKPALGSDDEFMLSHVTRIDVAKPSTKDHKVFAAFANEVKSSWTSSPGSYQPGLSQQWACEKGNEESIDFAGPVMACKIASNEDWAIEFRQINGQWKACRLLLMGH